MSRVTTLERFQHFIDKTDDNCMIWNGNTNKFGYGKLKLNGKSHLRLGTHKDNTQDSIRKGRFDGSLRNMNKKKAPEGAL